MKKLIVLLLAAMIITTGCTEQNEKSYYELTDTESAPVSIPEPKKKPEPDKKEEIPEVETYINHDAFSPSDLIEEYSSALTAAINNGKFSLVQKYLLKDSKLYNMQMSLVENLFAAGTKEYMLETMVTDYYWETNTKGHIYTYEKAEIINSSEKSEIKEYHWEYTVEYKNGMYYLSDISAL